MKRSVSIMLLTVSSVLAQEAEDIRGPKPPVELPDTVPVTPWGMYALIAFIALGIIGGLLWWLLRKQVVATTPEEIARKELSRLRAKCDLMKADEFAEAASGVLRRFIECRFGVAAPKRTTEEFLQEVVRGAHGLEDRAETLREFLRACDLVKFAGEDLDKLQREDLAFKAWGFVNEVPKTTEVAA
ncbi:MAG: DUF4381 domain-containing protein [Akkermansiaceae bacterium]|nr:DUF4381 domain-containing protein [Akkermansiaceae bacterium]